MGDENPIRTLGDYSKPSHEGYRNTIELPIGNNVVPLRSDSIRLVQNGCSFYGLQSEDPNQHLTNCLKLVDSLDLDGSITTWEDLTTRILAQFFPPRRTKKLRNDIPMFQQHHGESLSEAWTRFKDLLLKVPHHEELAQYEDEGWNEPVNPEYGDLNYENPNIEQLLGIMEHKVDALMNNALSAMGKSKGMFEMTRNEMIRRLEDYMQVIAEEFMEFSSEVARILKERIKENKNKPRKIEKITKYPDTKALKNSAKHNFLENLEKKTFPTLANLLCVRYFRLIPSNPSQPRKNTFGFKPGKRANQSHHNSSNSLTVRPPTQSDPTFVDDDLIKRDPSPYFLFTYEISNRARNTIGQASSSREETMEEKVRKFGLFNYEDHQMNYDNLAGRSIHLRGVVDWEFLSNKGISQYEPLHKGVTFRLGEVENEMSLLELGWRVGLYFERESRDVVTLISLRRAETVNSTHLTHLFWPSIRDDMFNVKKSLVKMEVIMELHEGECCWPITRGVVEEDKGDDEEGDGEGGNEGAGGSADIYRNMSTGDWQHMSTRDNLEPHLQIDPFPEFEADYPPYGHHGHMPPGYTYHPNPSQDGSS
ncbi:zinc finger, CCHC-type containing protein [Tanacetum coccineum]